MRRLAILIVLASAACGAARSTQTPTPPSRVPASTPTAVPTSSASPLVVSPLPAAAPLVLSNATIGADARPSLLFRVPGEDHLRAVSWDGTRNGVLKGQVSPTAIWSQSPDGSRYVIDRMVYDRDGRQVGALPWQDTDQFTWAKGGEFACKAAHQAAASGGSGTPLRLETAVPGQPPRVVAAGYGTYSDNARYDVLACDPKTDRAIVAAFGQGLFAGRLWVFRLSTGALVRSADLGAGATGSWVTASDDGAMLAESIRDAVGSTTTTIRRADDGASLGTVKDFEAHGFLTDGSLLNGFGVRDAKDLVDWKTGRVLWSATGYVYRNGFVPDPAGGHIAIALGFDGTLKDQDVFIVAADGTSMRLPKGVLIGGRC